MRFPALSNAGFRRYFLASLLNVNAIWIQRVALSWIAWDLTGSAGFVGLVAGLSLLPTLVTGPAFGVWVDRTDILRAAALTSLVKITLILITAALLALGLLNAVVLVGVAFAVGAAASAYNPVRMSLAPRLVPSDLVSGVVALTAVNFNVARLAAPVLAGVMIAQVGIIPTLLLAAALLVPLLFVLPGLDPRPLPPPKGTPLSPLRSFVEGVRHARESPLIFRCILAMSVFTFAGRGLLELLPVIADGLFQRGASGFGLLTGAAGAGALASAGWVAMRSGRPAATDIPHSTIAALLLSQILVALIAVIPSWPAMLVLICALGACATLVGVSLQTVIQNRLEDEMRGRVMSLWIMMGFGMAAIGAMVIGAVAEVTGIGLSSALFGLLGLAMVAAILFAPRGTFAAR